MKAKSLFIIGLLISFSVTAILLVTMNLDAINEYYELKDFNKSAKELGFLSHDKLNDKCYFNENYKENGKPRSYALDGECQVAIEFLEFSNKSMETCEICGQSG